MDTSAANPCIVFCVYVVYLFIVLLLILCIYIYIYIEMYSYIYGFLSFVFGIVIYISLLC